MTPGYGGSGPISAKEPAGRETHTAMAGVGVGAKVLQAVSAGSVAAVVSAMLAAVTEPIMNRVLVKRMSIKAAIGEMTPKLVLSFFATTISTNLLKFPLFEAVAMFLSLLPNMSNVVRGLIAGFIFTTATLPITNFRYRMSIQTPMEEALKPSNLYQAYLPTVVRDMAYASARNLLAALMMGTFVGMNPGSPQMMFPVVIGACVISAPFNEVRGFLLQSGAKKLKFSEFFKPASFARSTILGAVNMGVSVSVGYFLTPIVGRYVTKLQGALDSGSWVALLGLVAALDLMMVLVAKGFSSKVYSRAIDANKGLAGGVESNADAIQNNSDKIAEILERMKALESENQKLSTKVVSLGGTVEEP
eukprot:CAMPEP_0197653320 /NCGR_PEP_ID=MMETSP1338-20131121/35018_1 /TAXON_ID=43686 ORGANISM="Pelagodinium beii, Strain RCC1491" /NCGR_SAMPLE_ID=MMETSP1338 /ASSEMBLY_ACC=CAM_ASM_000754 /LENGTH=360 /DNA_ID=CAMNT_0043228377 /DNA_START=180 /DNA_END=1262 /DNA_ORIENTATION=+